MMTTVDVMKDLVFGALDKKVVKIVYKCLNDAAQRGLLARSIQPVRWEVGRYGVMQVIAWDLDRHGWRRYAVDNIIAIVVTDDTWRRDIEHQIFELPNGMTFLGDLNVG